MANRRVYYATYRVGIAPFDTNYTSVRGLQSVTMNTSFNLEQAFEIGQQAIYENIEGIPDIECSMEKLLDGSCPIYILATCSSATNATLAGRSEARCNVGMQIYGDAVSSAGYGGAAPVSSVSLSGMYVSSVAYAVPIDGNATESVSLVGNNKAWRAGSALTFLDNPFLTNVDAPISITGSGGINRRENVLLGATGSVFPAQIPGVVSDAGGSGRITLTGVDYSAHLTNISISTDLGREEMFELGRKGPYYRFVNFPIEVTTEIGMISSSGDMVNAIEDVTAGSCEGSSNLTDQIIILKMCEGLIVDCGSKNKLASSNVTGGDATGGNQEITYTYTNFNDFTVYHPKDPDYPDVGFIYTGG
jgi:hypothetical protein